MATLYFNGAVNNNWATLGNWWSDSAQTVPAAALPSSSDSVVITSTVASNSGSAPTIVDLTAEASTVNINISVSGVATFINGSTLSSGRTLTNTGLASFIGESDNDGTVAGNAAFEGSTNSGTVSGNATFALGSQHSGSVGGDATFTDSTINYGASVGGDLTATNGGTQGGIVSITGNATLYGSFYGDMYVTGTCALYDGAWMTGNAGGGLTVNDYATGACGWGGTATFNDDSYCSSYAGDSFGDAVFNDNATNNGHTESATFNNFSEQSVSGYTWNGAVFNDDTADSGYNYGATYFGRSHAIGGYNALSVLFNGRSRASDMFLDTYNGAGMEISGGTVGVYGLFASPSFTNVTVTFTRAGLGVNGSSILGVV